MHLNALIPRVLRINDREETTEGVDHSPLPGINATPGSDLALRHSVKGSYPFDPEDADAIAPSTATTIGSRFELFFRREERERRRVPYGHEP
jgi:hypothetical protein